MFEDHFDNLLVPDKGDDLHLTLAPGTGQGIGLPNLAGLCGHSGLPSFQGFTDVAKGRFGSGIGVLNVR